MLPKLVTDLLWIDFKKQADMASARGGAEQIGLLKKFDAAMAVNSRDPWLTVRDLIAAR